jgi:hypothetical protein
MRVLSISLLTIEGDLTEGVLIWRPGLGLCERRPHQISSKTAAIPDLPGRSGRDRRYIRILQMQCSGLGLNGLEQLLALGFVRGLAISHQHLFERREIFVQPSVFYGRGEVRNKLGI